MDRLESFHSLFFTGYLLGFTSFALILGIGVPTADAADYESLLREGVALRRSGDDSSALKEFQQAYEVNHAPKALAQIGMAEQALGRWVAADAHLRQAIATEDSWIHKNRGTIDQALAVISTHVGQLGIEGTPPGAEVRVDGDLVGRLPLSHPVTVAAGGVAVEVRAPGYIAIVRTPIVAPQTLIRESISLQPLPTAPPPVAGATTTSPSHEVSTATADRAPPESAQVVSSSDNATAVESSTAAAAGNSSTSNGGEGTGLRRGLILGAVGLSVASLGLGIFEHVTWQGRVNSFGSPNSGCGTTLPQNGVEGCRQLLADGKRARTLAFLGYGLAGAFAVTALIIHLTDGGAGQEPKKVACAPAVLTPGFMCALRF